MPKAHARDVPEGTLAALGPARVSFEGGRLIVTTGRVTRQWRWTGAGLATVSLVDVESGRQWVTGEPACRCDWSLAGRIDGDSAAELISLTAAESDDEGFTSGHLEVIAAIEYPRAKVAVQVVIWAYPDAPGLRTQLRAKALPGQAPPAEAAPSRCDLIPAATGGLTRRAIGYYNETQQRNRPETDLLAEEITDEAEIDWANILCLEDARGGLAVVKESHKCVNQPGYDTGGFTVAPAALATTGWGLTAADLPGDRFGAGWATWCVLWAGGDEKRELAIKIFDRVRYPVDPAADMYVKANTWGSGDTGRQSRDQASEANVLAEIDSVAELGIELLQIDDGWQVDADATGPRPGEELGWKPHPQTYPDGWANVVARAAEKRVKLAIWAPAQQISLEEMKWNFDRAGFVAWKLDFANLGTYEKLEETMAKVRAFLLYAGGEAHAVWDVTENPPRYGYYWAKEYGCLWLENRKPHHPESVIAIPHLILRDAWQLARYTNLNKFQLPVQNIERVDRDRSDAYLHNHPYSVAVALMGLPVFFQTTRHYTGEAREQVRQVLELYKAHREGLFTRYLFPIGAKPDNASFTGFQAYRPDDPVGYLMVYRELHAPEPTGTVNVRFLAGQTLELTDLRDGATRTVTVGADGAVPFTIDTPADFAFFRYEVR